MKKGVVCSVIFFSLFVTPTLSAHTLLEAEVKLQKRKHCVRLRIVLLLGLPWLAATGIAYPWLSLRWVRQILKFVRETINETP